MSADEPPHPDAGGGHEPEMHGEMIRDDGERLFVQWFTGKDTSSFVHLLSEERGEEDRVFTLDSIELPQAMRALRAVVHDDADGAPVRDMGVFERLWVEAESRYVTVHKEELQETAELVVLERSEAKHLLDIIDGILSDLDDVEDNPYV